MGFYSKYVLPSLTDLAMRGKAARIERAKLVPLAGGVVLEVGVGSGLNIPFYGPQVGRPFALEPSAELLRMARRRMAQAAFPVDILPHPAEAIPLEDSCVNTVVTTWTLCTIADPLRALSEMRRVLRPEGQLIFIEHGRAPDTNVAAWQDRLTPLWRRLAGGCHLNRRIDQVLRAGGFEFSTIEMAYTAGPRVGAYLYRGIARPSGTAERAREQGAATA